MIHTVCHECNGSGYTTWLRCAMSTKRERLTFGPYKLPVTQVIVMVSTRHEKPRPCMWCLAVGGLPGIVAPV